jgi:hypothetical protein
MPNSRHNSLNTPWLLQPKDWRGEHHPKWFTSWGYDKRRNNEKTHSFWCRWDPICVYSESFLMFICLSQTMMRCLGILDVCPNFAKKQPNNQLLLHWGHLIRSPVPLSALLPPLLGSFLLPVICAQSLKIAVRSFPLIMYLGLKSIMILKILISIINLYIYIYQDHVFSIMVYQPQYQRCGWKTHQIHFLLSFGGNIEPPDCDAMVSCPGAIMNGWIL